MNQANKKMMFFQGNMKRIAFIFLLLHKGRWRSHGDI